MDLAKDGQYHLACAKYFEVAHNKPSGKPLLHPNAYFAESRALLSDEDGSKGKGKKKERARDSSALRRHNSVNRRSF